MRASVRPSLGMPIVIAAVPTSRALARPAPPVGATPGEPPEELTVLGAKTLEQYRLELAAAGFVKAYDEANSSNDIGGRNERVTGIRSTNARVLMPEE